MAVYSYIINSDDWVEVRKLGSGGYSSVYLVQNKSSGEESALKIFSCSDEDNARVFMNEFELFAAVDHPCVLKCRGVIMPTLLHGGGILVGFCPITSVLERIPKGVDVGVFNHTWQTKEDLQDMCNLVEFAFQITIKGRREVLAPFQCEDSSEP